MYVSMRFVSCHDGKLQVTSPLTAQEAGNIPLGRAFMTDLGSWDELAPAHHFARGAIHELLFDAPHGQPEFVAALLAQKAAGLLLPVIWCDRRAQVYPPALASAGFDLTKFYLLHPDSESAAAWAIAECLRCRGVGAVIAAGPTRLSRIEARRLQLAAERGGSVGILLRQRGRGDDIYAAATRWLVQPYPGERTIQRWAIQLLHGHGGRVGQTVILECCRETNSVRALEKLDHRSVAETVKTRRAIA
jgi:protein ImuA